MGVEPVITNTGARRTLRKLELEAYAAVVSAFRAQGPLTNDKKSSLEFLSKLLGISPERHRAEIRRAVNDDHLASVAGCLTGYETDKAWRKEGQKLASTNARFVSRPASHIPQVLTVATLTAAAAASQKGGASTTKAPPTSGSGTDLDFKKAIHVQLQNALRLVMSQNPTASGATTRVPLTQEGKTVSPLRPQSAPSTPVKMLTSATRTPSPSKNLSPSTQSQLLTPATVTYKLAGTTKVIASSPRKVANVGTTSQTSVATTSQATKTKVDAAATDTVSKKNKLSAIESLLCEETISPKNSPGPAKSHMKDEVSVVAPENASPKVVLKAQISMTQEEKGESSEPSSQKVVTVTAVKLKDHTEGEKEGQPVTEKISKSPVEEETQSEVSNKLPTTSTVGSEEIKLGKLVSAVVVGATNHPPVEQATLKEGTTSTGGEVVASEEASKIDDVAHATANDQVKVPKPSPSPSQSINSIPKQAVIHVTVNRLAKESEGTQPSVVEVRTSKSNPPSSSTIIATPPPPAHEKDMDLSILKSARKRSPSPSFFSESRPPTKKRAIAPPLEDVVTTIAPSSQSTPLLSTTTSTQASSTITPQAFSTTPLQPTTNEASDLPLEVSTLTEMAPPLSTTLTAATTTQASNTATRTTTVAVDAPVKELTPFTSSQPVSLLSTTTAATPQASNTTVVTTVSTAITTTTPASKMAIEPPVETITYSPSSQITPLLSTANAPAPTATAVTEAAAMCSLVKLPTLTSSTLTTPSFSNFGTVASSTATVTTATAPPPMETLLFFSSTQTTPLISNTTTMAAQAPVTASVPGDLSLEVLLPATSEVDGTAPSQLQGEVSTDSLIQSLCSDSTSFEEDPDVSVLASQLGIDSVDSPIFNLSGFLSFIQPDLSVLSQDGQAPQADSGKLLGDALSMCSAEFNTSHGTNLEGLERQQSATGVDETQVQPKSDQLVSLVQRMTTSVPVTQISSKSSTTSLSVSDAITTVIGPSLTPSQQPPSPMPAVCSSTPAPVHVHPSLVPESITPAPFQPIPVQESITPASTQPVSVPESIIPPSTLLPESMATSSLLPVPDPESITLAPIQPVPHSQLVTPSVPSTAIVPEDPVPPRPLLLKFCSLPTGSLNLSETPTSPLGSTPTTPQLPLTPTPHTPLGEGLLDISDIGSLMDVSEAMDGISQDVFESIEKLVNLDEQSTNATWK